RVLDDATKAALRRLRVQMWGVGREQGRREQGTERRRERPHRSPSIDWLQSRVGYADVVALYLRIRDGIFTRRAAASGLEWQERQDRLGGKEREGGRETGRQGSAEE